MAVSAADEKEAAVAQPEQAAVNSVKTMTVSAADEKEAALAQPEQAAVNNVKTVAITVGGEAEALAISTGEAKRLKEKIRKKKSKEKNRVKEMGMKNIPIKEMRGDICWKFVQGDIKSEAA